MHFSIPDTVEQKDAKGNSYTCYSIHINGSPHCRVRYSQLHALHEQLRRKFLRSTLPSFPVKRFLPLTVSQIEDRRLQLEKYLQLISQDLRINNSVVFNGFLLAAQRETQDEIFATLKTDEDEEDENTRLDVYLMNDHKISVRGPTVLQTDQVLENVCAQLNVPEDYVYYFALFLIQKHSDNTVAIVRKLQDFESPYISQRAAGAGTLKLVLRKCCWDSDLDTLLFSNKVTLNLLYIQTLSDVERNWVQASHETKKTLARMQARGAKQEYMDLARQLKYYGYIHFMPCFCDYPVSNTPVRVAIGVRELLIRIADPVTGETKEGGFKVTKMRCWRIMTLTNPQDGDSNKLELSFEYLMNNQQLQWITIVSSQAILMSICLQSMVEELLRKKNQIPIKKAGEKSCVMEYSYPKKDGSYQILSIRAGLHSKVCSKRLEHDNINHSNENIGSMTRRQYSVKRLSESFNVVNMRETSRAAEDVFIENEAFLDIRDEDL